ncbi:two-component system OmpR family response regulator [Panacagrimonas perspica]|uniref:Two-component system OmpR family response regulator n=1 Tax=Panacagrimonas perspica TaxID=381431 RepID=A0A4S3K3E1_9GAMM|nr:response regulator transcription factor [Panacagrimonas perspica]TDU28946.1 two-component system OmpR family response regulator [Panacagrimonas perspica]THD02234.1 DNA-binding response regulator [Panacagrimonas perspica]
MRLLLAEDDRALADGLAGVLAQSGFTVDQADCGLKADFLVRTEAYDLVILDLGLPRRDGLSLLRDWREAGYHQPVLILTARSRWPDKAAGFGAGADDYVAKPFEPMEVVMRAQALIRRSRGQSQPLLTVGAITVDMNQGRVWVDGRPVTLTQQEYKMLAYLMLSKDRVVSRTELIEHVYARDRDPDSNVVDVLIGRIRRRLGSELIETVRGRGFLIRTPDAA